MKKLGKRTVFYKNSFMQYIIVLGTYVFPLLTFPYLTRVLSPDNFGVVSYVNSFMAYFMFIVDFGFILSGTKRVSRHHYSKIGVSFILIEITLVKILLAFASFAFLLVIIPFVELLSFNMLFVLLSFIPVVLSCFLPDFLYRGIEKMEVLTVRFVLSKGLTTLLTFLLVRSSKDILLVPILSASGSLLAIIMTFIDLKKRGFLTPFMLMHLNKITKVIKIIRDNISNSFVFFLSSFATTLYGISNSVFIGLFLSVEDVACWGVAYTLITSAQSMYNPIVNSLYPHMLKHKDFVFIKKILMVLMPLIVMVVIILFVYSPFIIRLISGDGYEAAISPFRLLLPVLVFSFPVLLFGWPTLGILGKEKSTTASTVLTGLLHFASLIIMSLFGVVSLVTVSILRSVTELFILIYRWVSIMRVRS